MRDKTAKDEHAINVKTETARETYREYGAFGDNAAELGSRSDQRVPARARIGPTEVDPPPSQIRRSDARPRKLHCAVLRSGAAGGRSRSADALARTRPNRDVERELGNRPAADSNAEAHSPREVLGDPRRGPQRGWRDVCQGGKVASGKSAYLSSGRGFGASCSYPVRPFDSGTPRTRHPANDTL